MKRQYVFTRATWLKTKKKGATLVISRVRVSGEILAQVVINGSGEISRISCTDFGLEYLEKTDVPVVPYTSEYGKFEICTEVEFDVLWKLAEKYQSAL